MAPEGVRDLGLVVNVVIYKKMHLKAMPEMHSCRSIKSPSQKRVKTHTESVGLDFLEILHF
jgi:hypothetical protein